MKFIRSLFILTFCLTGTVFAQDAKTMIFGGDNHDVYLGCLTCSEFDSDSVTNEFGTYGSEFSQESVLNDFSKYGSKFSDLSACNSFAQDPPVIVDDEGNFYGRLTLNKFHPEAITVEGILEWLEFVACG